jgi:hypothetical protein
MDSPPFRSSKGTRIYAFKRLPHILAPFSRHFYVYTMKRIADELHPGLLLVDALISSIEVHFDKGLAKELFHQRKMNSITQDEQEDNIILKSPFLSRFYASYTL